jgi:hypothetical protein
VKPDYKSISPIPWDAEEIGVNEWFLVSREKNAKGEDDGWLRIGEIDSGADIAYIVHAANNYPRLVAAVTEIQWTRGRCPSCGVEEVSKHAYRTHHDACALAAALREAGEL